MQKSGAKKVRTRCLLPGHEDVHPSAFYVEEEDCYYCSRCGFRKLSDIRTEGWEDVVKSRSIVSGNIRALDEGNARGAESLAEILARNGQTLGSLLEVGATFTQDWIEFHGIGGVDVRRYCGNDASIPRYLHASGGKRLFALREYSEASEVILCEGPFDVVGLQSCIDIPVVASCGTPSNEQLYWLRDKTTFLVMDNDYAGWKETKDAVKILTEMGGKSIVFELPWADPGEAHTDGDRTELKQWLEQKIGIYSFSSDISQEIPQPTGFRETPWHSLNGILGGGFSSGSHVFNGAPGSGKSMLLLSIAKHFVNHDYNVTFASYELSILECVARLQGYDLRVPWLDILQGKVKPVPLAPNIKIVFAPQLGELMHYAEQSDVLIVDYLQQMAHSVGNGTDNAKQSIDKIVPDLSAFANSRGKTILFASAVTASDYHRATMHSKESGVIEYGASSVSALRSFKDRLYLYIVKNRYGKKGKVMLNADWSSGQFYE